MAPLNGSELEVHIETAVADTYVLIDGLDAYSRSNSATVEKRPTFGRDTPYALPGLPDEGIDLAGIFNPTDPGQARLFTQLRARVPFKIKVFYDDANTDGYTQEVVGSTSGHDASAEPGFQEISVTLTPNADPVIVGAGPLPW